MTNINTIKTSFNGVTYNNDFDDKFFNDDFKKMNISDKNNLVKQKLIIDIFNDVNVIRQQNYFIINKNLYLNNLNPFHVNWITVNIEFNKNLIKGDMPFYIAKYRKGNIEKINSNIFNITPYQI